MIRETPGQISNEILALAMAGRPRLAQPIPEEVPEPQDLNDDLVSEMAAAWDADPVSGVTVVFERYSDEEVELSDLQAIPEGKGLGSEAMAKIVATADRLGVNLMLIPAGEKGSDKLQRLLNFYSRFGFYEDGELMRRPSRKNLVAAADHPEQQKLREHVLRQIDEAEIAASGVARSVDDYTWSEEPAFPLVKTNWGADSVEAVREWLEREERDYTEDMGQPRVSGGDEAKRQDLKNDPIVIVEAADKTFWVLDGNHRVAQALVWSMETLPAIVGRLSPMARRGLGGARATLGPDSSMRAIIEFLKTRLGQEESVKVTTSEIFSAVFADLPGTEMFRASIMEKALHDLDERGQITYLADDADVIYPRDLRRRGECGKCGSETVIGKEGLCDICESEGLEQNSALGRWRRRAQKGGKRRATAEEVSAIRAVAGEADDYTWVLDPVFSYAKLDFVKEDKDMGEWLRQEQEHSREAWSGMGEDYGPEFADVVESEPIIVIPWEGGWDTWDGQHRVAWATVHGMTQGPAFVGTPVRQTRTSIMGLWRQRARANKNRALVTAEAQGGSEAMIVVHFDSLDTMTWETPEEATEMASRLASVILGHAGPVYIISQGWTATPDSGPRLAAIEAIGEGGSQAKIVPFDESTGDWEKFLPEFLKQLESEGVGSAIVTGLWWDPESDSGCAHEVYKFLSQHMPVSCSEQLLARPGKKLARLAASSEAPLIMVVVDPPLIGWREVKGGEKGRREFEQGIALSVIENQGDFTQVHVAEDRGEGIYLVRTEELGRRARDYTSGWRWNSSSNKNRARVTAAAQESSLAEWFGDSKVVDAQGKPLVVYHGAPTAGFKKFKEGSYGGSYFTSDPALASAYAETETIGKNPGVYPVYLKIENPAVIGESGPGMDFISEWYQAVYGEKYQGGAESIAEAEKSGRGEFWQLFEAMSEEEDLAAALKDAGFDGAIFKEESGTTYVAFSPDQIRSATAERRAASETVILSDELRIWGRVPKSQEDHVPSVVLSKGTRVKVLKTFRLDHGGNPELAEVAFLRESEREPGAGIVRLSDLLAISGGTVETPPEFMAKGLGMFEDAPTTEAPAVFTIKDVPTVDPDMEFDRLIKMRDEGKITPEQFDEKSKKLFGFKTMWMQRRARSQFNAMIDAYIMAALWSSVDQSGQPLDGDPYSDYEVDQLSMEQAVADVRSFTDKAGDLLDDIDAEQAGHDFWLTRNGHGAGFWDRGYEEKVGKGLTDLAHSFGEVHIIVDPDVEEGGTGGEGKYRFKNFEADRSRFEAAILKRLQEGASFISEDGRELDVDVLPEDTPSISAAINKLLLFKKITFNETTRNFSLGEGLGQEPKPAPASESAPQPSTEDRQQQIDSLLDQWNSATPEQRTQIEEQLKTLRAMKSLWMRRRAESSLYNAGLIEMFLQEMQGSADLVTATTLEIEDLNGKEKAIKFPRAHYDQYVKILSEGNRETQENPKPMEFWTKVFSLKEALIEFAASQIIPDQKMRDNAPTIHGQIRTAMEYLGYGREHPEPEPEKTMSAEDDIKLKETVFGFFEQQKAQDLTPHQMASLMMNVAQVLIDDWGWEQEPAREKIKNWFVEWGGGGPENIHLNSLHQRWTRRAASTPEQDMQVLFSDMEVVKLYQIFTSRGFSLEPLGNGQFTVNGPGGSAQASLAKVRNFFLDVYPKHLEREKQEPQSADYQKGFELGQRWVVEMEAYDDWLRNWDPWEELEGEINRTEGAVSIMCDQKHEHRKDRKGCNWVAAYPYLPEGFEAAGDKEEFKRGLVDGAYAGANDQLYGDPKNRRERPDQEAGFKNRWLRRAEPPTVKTRNELPEPVAPSPALSGFIDPEGNFYALGSDESHVAFAARYLHPLGLYDAKSGRWPEGWIRVGSYGDLGMEFTAWPGAAAWSTASRYVLGADSFIEFYIENMDAGESMHGTATVDDFRRSQKTLEEFVQGSWRQEASSRSRWLQRRGKFVNKSVPEPGNRQMVAHV